MAAVHPVDVSRDTVNLGARQQLQRQAVHPQLERRIALAVHRQDRPHPLRLVALEIAANVHIAVAAVVLDVLLSCCIHMTKKRDTGETWCSRPMSRVDAAADSVYLRMPNALQQ